MDDREQAITDRLAAATPEPADLAWLLDKLAEERRLRRQLEFDIERWLRRSGTSLGSVYLNSPHLTKHQAPELHRLRDKLDRQREELHRLREELEQK